MSYFLFQFQQYQLGYMTKDPETVLSGFLDYLTRNESDKLLPGEGVRVLTLTQNILDYLGKSKLSIRASKTVTKTVLSIIDNVLMVPKSIVKSTVSSQIIFILSILNCLL